MLESLFTNEECEISLWTAPLLMTISRMEARWLVTSVACLADNRYFETTSADL